MGADRLDTAGGRFMEEDSLAAHLSEEFWEDC
jgi:hypothetical protein